MLILIFSILFFTIFFLFFFKEIELLKIKKFSLISSGLVLILSTIILIDFDTNKLFNQNITSLTIGAEHLNFIYMFGFDGISLLFFFLSAFLIFICILFI
jgi:NADH:ubiquinone oxidoreductase subunit 4 (subunit M)